MCACLVAQSCRLFVTHGLQPARLLCFPRQEHWRWVPSPGDLPHLGMEPASPGLAGRFFTTEPPGKPHSPPPRRPKTLKEMVLSAVSLLLALEANCPQTHLPAHHCPSSSPSSLLSMIPPPPHRSSQTLSLVSLPPWTPLSAANLSMVLLLPPSFIRSSSKV